MGRIMDLVRGCLARAGGVDSLPRVDQFSYPRSSRQAKMRIREAIRKCIRVNKPLGAKEHNCRAGEAAFMCLECERIIAYVDFSDVSSDVRSLTVDIMSAAQEEKFSCQLCGGVTFGLGPR